MQRFILLHSVCAGHIISAHSICVDCPSHLYSEFIFLYAYTKFLSKQVIFIVQQSTRKGIHMISPKLELGINPVSEETWKGFSSSVRLREGRIYIPETEEKRRQDLFDLISSIGIPPCLRSYHGQIQETDVCIKKNLPWVSVAVYPIFTLPSRLRLCPTRPKQQIGMYKLEPVEEFKERWDGPMLGMLEKRSHCDKKWNKKTSFPIERKPFFPSSGSTSQWALLFSKWRHSLWAAPLYFHQFSMVSQQKKKCLNFFEPDGSTESLHINNLSMYISLFMTPLLNWICLLWLSHEIWVTASPRRWFCLVDL